MLAPNILTYFWPLLLSTTLLLVTILAFNNVPPLAVEFSNGTNIKSNLKSSNIWSPATVLKALRVRENLTMNSAALDEEQ
ncbi:hypothetical protein H5410_020506 [Solanum commersonii]|uniref:Uncharacterized protein n=1 Tax=Solanum commersonii TaxID=4109 RepID=A0A9J5Z8M5_SOLCO|nr:hypothetical protein H5410_020506 [Solanum commersonii]